MNSRLAKYGKVWVALWMVVTLYACSDDTGVLGEYRPSDVICFTASLSADAQAVHSRGGVPYLDIVEEEWELEGVSSSDSRGSVVSGLNGLKVGVIGTVYDQQGALSNTLMSNHLFTFANNEELRSSVPVFWKNVGDNKKLRIYSYAPYVGTNTGNFSVTTVDGEPGVTYSVPADVATQTDIIASDMKEVPGDYKQYIPLAYNHILTGIRFKAGFDCLVKKIEIQNIHGKGTYALSGTWSGQTGTNGTSGSDSYAIEFNGGKSCTVGTMITDVASIFMMIPQQLPDAAQVVLTYDTDKTITASLKGLKWEPGKLITYTINKEATSATGYVYFDLHAGNVTITPTTYTGYVYVKGEAQKVSGTTSSTSAKKFYVYQSTDANKSNTGWESAIGTGTCRIPSYQPVMVDGRFWSDYITNNTDVEAVIAAWDNEKGAGKGAERDAFANKPNQDGASGAVRTVGRTATKNCIHINGDVGNVDLTIDNIYSSFQQKNSTTSSEHIVRTRDQGGISFLPSETSGNSTLTINILGDNRLGCVNYQNNKPDKNCLVFQGTGSLTVADVDYFRDGSGLGSNRSCSVIGGKDSPENKDDVYNIVFNSGVIYAGATTSSCTAIGGGGNGHTKITINGGSITAVAATTGTAIGGGTGLLYEGGKGDITITGGNVYAYNYENSSKVPSSAIGGAGSRDKAGEKGTISISGGYVYAYSKSGAAIGGGSSNTQKGGDADVTINGGYIIALSATSTSIGGGLGGTGTASDEETTIPAYGGSATVNISGNPTIRTGSIGGGKTNNESGKIGSATITVGGGDISAQFVMAAGASEASSFTMTGGTISNSDVNDKEYYHIVKNGGAVYMEDGTFTMSGENTIIRNCKGQTGGAVYINKNANAIASPTFTMSGGHIENCSSETHGGAVYLEEGTVTVSGGTIQGNLAKQGHGGAVYIKAGSFYMPEGGNAVIKENAALGHGVSGAGNGGGVYVTSATSATSDVAVEVLSGTIENNSCDDNGGGICVDMSANNTCTANVIIGKDGSASEANPSITNNWAVMYGGGLYAIGAKANVVINGGKITDNHVPNYVPNMDVANEKGMVTLNGGNVKHQTITFKANAADATVDGEPEVVQKIVTNTNSFLKLPPEPQRSLYTFVKWNRRPDGLDPEEFEDGQIMNIKEDITLYAIWEAQ